MRARRVVGGVGRHVAVEENNVVGGQQVRDPIRRTRAVQGEQDCHRVHGFSQVSVRSFECLGSKIRVDRLPVPRKIQSRDRRAAAAEFALHFADQRSLSSAVEASNATSVPTADKPIPPGLLAQTGGDGGHYILSDESPGQ